MQFKLIALLTLAIASVNGAAIQKRAGGVYTPSISLRGPNIRFSGTCNCGGTVYNSAVITAAVGQSAHGPFGLYVSHLDVLPSFSSPLSQPPLPSPVQQS